MFGISFEHILILGVILIVVGPRRLPELGNMVGKGIKNFKDSFSGIEEASFKRLITPETRTPTADSTPAQTAAPLAAASEVTPAALASSGVSVPPSSPLATAAPLAAGTASVTDPSHSDPHKG